MPEYGLNIGSRRSVNVITPTFDRDFVTFGTLNHGVGPNITFTRASSATVFTSTGILSTVPNNVPRFEWGNFRTNYIRNSNATGAVNGVIGQGGALPTFWNATGHIINNLSATIVGTGTENNIPYLDLRINGTPDNNGTAFINADFATFIPAVSGQTWTMSSYIKLASGSLTNITYIRTSFYARDPISNIYGQSNFVNITPTTGSLDSQRASFTFTFSNSSVAGILPVPLQFYYTVNAPIDATFRIGAPQLELSSAATAFIPTTNAPVTTGVPLGLLIEESRTNFVPTNNVFNWGYNSEIVSVSGGTGFAGISSYIASDTSDSFRDAVYTLFLSPLLTATPYTFSCYIKKDFRADNLYPLLRIRDSANNYYGTFFNQALGTWIEGKSGPDSAQTFITNISVVDLNTHWKFWYTFNSPVTSQPIQLQIYPAHSNTTTVTGSIEVAGIQVEQGSFPTSYIPTAGLSATRQGDDARISSINTSSFYNQDQGTIFMETQYLPYRFTSSTSPGLWTLDTGAFAQGYGLLYAGNSLRLQLYTRNLGNTITYIDTLPNTTPELTRSAAVVSPTFRNLFFNGVLANTQGGGANTTPYVFPPITTFRIGYNYIAGNPPVNFFGGYIRKVTYWPTRLSNNRLRTLTLSA